MLETDIKVTAEVARQHGLTAQEYARILEILGREPNITELGVFSVMWSEHCSYKSSKVHLKRLPTAGPQVVQGPGENAGVVDIGDGLCAVFKIESHNHPSFVEPFQGAATGVGGILRDIFTMGARPVAVLDSLRFGPIAPGAEPSAAAVELARNRRILDGVISGIAFYGNCFGVPTVGGEIHFEPCYSSNPLVNVLALGIARRDELFFARARGPGNPVIYVGAKTGRDGIHGASLLASASFTEESQQKRPNVQVGDPFREKLLLEACLEVMRTGSVISIQDMGAAGLTCSSCEMASRGGTGIEIELARVPQRDTGMTPYEILLSESQERMLLVAEKGREDEVLGVFAKWGLDAVVVGRITGDGRLRVTERGCVVCDVPAHALAEEGPVYRRPVREPPARTDQRLVSFAPAGTDLTENFRRLLASPAIASKRWVFEQYDHMVRTNTLVGPGAGDAAVMRVKGTRRALALATDGSGRWCALDPYLGAMHAVAEAARNVACAGARPIAATNCLNFGNPEKPEVMWQFSRVVDGMAEACRALGVPITGGNVSFYNETLDQSIHPTPVVGVLGLLEDASCALGMAFQREGDVILLLDGGVAEPEEKLDEELATLRQRTQEARRERERRGIFVDRWFGDDMDDGEWLAAFDRWLRWLREFSSSEYAKIVSGIVAGMPPHCDLHAEKRLADALVALVGEGAIASAHDISDGGLAVAVAECCFAASVSADIAVPAVGAGLQAAPAEYALFGEGGARAIVSCAPSRLARVTEIARQYQVAAREVGRVTARRPGKSSPEFCIRYNGQVVICAPIESLRETWTTALERAVKG